jgi:hypothetical protein
MKYKKFLLIPALLFFYLFFVVDMLVSFSPATVTEAEAGQSGGGVQTIGVGEAISATVTRPYFFGLIMLPVYTSGLGNIGIYHEAFFWFLGLLTAAFVFIEWRNSVAGESGYGIGYGRFGYKQSYNSEGMKMAKTGLGGFNAMAILKAIGVGIAFGVVSWFVSVILGDIGATTALMLLVMYLEYKFRSC